MKWIPNSWNIRDSSPFTALDLTPTFPRDPVPCKDLELGFSQFFIPGIWDGVESWQSQRAPGSVVVPFLPFLAPHMEKTRDFPGNSRIFQETPRFSRKLQDFPGIPAFQPGFGEKAGKPGIFTTFLAWFFWEAPAGSELCSGVPFPWEFPLHSGLIAFVSGAN